MCTQIDFDDPRVKGPFHRPCHILTSCILYMHGGVWRVCRAFSSVQKKWKEGLKVLGMCLATAVAKAVLEGNSQVFVTFVIIPLYFWSKMTARTGLFQAGS